MRLNFSTQRSREAGKCCQAETAFLPPQLFKSIQSWMTHQVAQHTRFLSLKHTPSNERLATSVCSTVKNRVSNATAWISPFEVSTTHSNSAPKNLAASTVLKPTRSPLVISATQSCIFIPVCAFKNRVHTGAAKFAIPLRCFRFLPEQEQRNETREKRGKGWKGKRCGGGIAPRVLKLSRRVGRWAFVAECTLQQERKYLSGSIVTHKILFRAN